jgi:hypothetical protein
MNRASAVVIAGIVGFVGIVGIADARVHRAWSYPELMKAADLVVIVTPGATTATGRKVAFSDITQVDQAGNKVALMGERLETDLEVVVVMKGKPLDVRGKDSTRIILYHLRESPQPAMSVNGPGLVSFDPSTKRQYVMFLVREKDGRYAAVSGQTDPDMAIEVLSHRAP